MRCSFTEMHIGMGQAKRQLGHQSSSSMHAAVRRHGHKLQCGRLSAIHLWLAMAAVVAVCQGLSCATVATSPLGGWLAVGRWLRISLLLLLCLHTQSKPCSGACRIQRQKSSCWPCRAADAHTGLLKQPCLCCILSM